MEILGIRVDNVSWEEARQKVKDFLSTGRQYKIYTPNPEMAVKATSDEYFRAALNRGDLNLCDGFGLVLAARFLGQGRLERVPGADFAMDICALASKEKAGVFLLGSGSDAVVKKAAENLQLKFPGIIISGFHPGPMVAEVADRIEVDEAINHKIIDQINQSGARILIVGFGMGKQEKWIDKYLPSMPTVTVASGFGGTIDFVAGDISRAPLFLRRIGLEWLYRLIRQPARFRRIFNATFVFTWLVFKSKI